METKKQHYFKEEIRRVLILYAFIPVSLITVVGFIAGWLFYNANMININKEDNRIIVEELQTSIQAYKQFVEETVEKEEVTTIDVNTEQRVELFEALYKINLDHNRKATIYLFDENLNSFIQSTSLLPHYVDGNYLKNWGIFRLMNDNPSRIVMKLINDENIDVMQLVLGKAIYKNNELQGYMVLNIDSRQFDTIISQLNTQCIVTDEFGWVYFGNAHNIINVYNKLDEDIESTGFNRLDSNRLNYITKSKIHDNIYVYTISSISQQIKLFLAFFIIFMIIFFMLAIAIRFSSKHMAETKTKKLYELLHAFEKAKEGDWDAYIASPAHNDEFDIIGSAYGELIESLQRQMQENKEMNQLIIQVQTEQLESQFNPHFLFNTLENIRFMCLLDPQKASQMSTKLSNLLRYSVANTREEVTVEEDLAYTETYLQILELRFNKTFNYTIDIDEKLMRCIIPKLIFQPVIENAVKYGFKGKENLHITICGYEENNNLYLVCTDDGIGIDQDKMSEIQSLLKMSTNTTNHLGLYNIHRRICLKYNKSYGLHISSEVGVGTQICIKVPMLFQES